MDGDCFDGLQYCALLLTPMQRDKQGSDNYTDRNLNSLNFNSFPNISYLFPKTSYLQLQTSYLQLRTSNFVPRTSKPRTSKPRTFTDDDTVRFSKS